MKKLVALLLALAGWYAIIAQFFLMLDSRVDDIGETTIRFLSYYTILTNILVAAYFTGLIFLPAKRGGTIGKPGTLTAITGYITMVGLIYQIALRHLWQPQGQQWVVDELLHTVIPLAVILFWYFGETSAPIRFQQIATWLIYPLLYLIFILVRGKYSGFYPYPFINVTALGLAKVLLNGALLFVLYILLSVLYIFLLTRSPGRS